MKEQDERDAETKLTELRQTINNSRGTESRAVAALHGVAGIYDQAQNMEQVRAITAALNRLSVSLGQTVTSSQTQQSAG